MKHALSHRRVRTAWIIAVAADLIQLAVFPVFIAGGASPSNAVLDVLVAALLISRVGWHWAFAPTFLAELLPGFDLVPTWTAAVWIATRGRAGGGAAPPPAAIS
jgi:hypothetical protein